MMQSGPVLRNMSLSYALVVTATWCACWSLAAKSGGRTRDMS